MATYALIHGASDSWYWHRVVPQLTALGHQVVAPDLPMGDPAAGYEEYTDIVINALGGERGEHRDHRDHDDLIVVGQSMGAFTAPMVCERTPARLLVLLAPMIPTPGESAGAWWGNTGLPQAQRDLAIREGRDPDAEFDPVEVFLHDLPADLVATAMARGETPLCDEIFARPWPLPAWPDVPTKVLLARQDRLLPADLIRRLATDRLNLTADELDGGHLIALGHPTDLVTQLEHYAKFAGR